MASRVAASDSGASSLERGRVMNVACALGVGAAWHWQGPLHVACTQQRFTLGRCRRACCINRPVPHRDSYVVGLRQLRGDAVTALPRNGVPGGPIQWHEPLPEFVTGGDAQANSLERGWGQGEWHGTTVCIRRARQGAAGRYLGLRRYTPTFRATRRPLVATPLQL